MQVFSARPGELARGSQRRNWYGQNGGSGPFGLFCAFKSLGWRFPKGDKATPDTRLPLNCLFSFIFISKPEDYIVGIAPIYTSVPEPSLCWGEGVVVLLTVSTRVNNADDSSTVEPRLLSEIYTNTYAGGGTVEGGVSGVELSTGLGAAASLAAGGAAGTAGRRSSAVGIQRDYGDTGLNLAFLDSYFSEVTSLHTAPQNSLGTE